MFYQKIACPKIFKRKLDGTATQRVLSLTELFSPSRWAEDVSYLLNCEVGSADLVEPFSGGIVAIFIDDIRPRLTIAIPHTEYFWTYLTLEAPGDHPGPTLIRIMHKDKE